VLWLPQGAAHDLDTNGHVDNIACFLRPGVIALLWAEPGENSEQHARSAAALTYLHGESDARDRSLEVVKILAPRPMKRRPDECVDLVGAPEDLAQVGDDLPGSYINFYIANGGVIVPQFGDVERDAQALVVLRNQFPEHEVVSNYVASLRCI
jgi:agmatine deiminase